MCLCRRSDSDDKDDPHKALGNIVLDDFLDPLPVKVLNLKKVERRSEYFSFNLISRRRRRRRSQNRTI